MNKSRHVRFICMSFISCATHLYVTGLLHVWRHLSMCNMTRSYLFVWLPSPYIYGIYTWDIYIKYYGTYYIYYIWEIYVFIWDIYEYIYIQSETWETYVYIYSYHIYIHLFSSLPRDGVTCELGVVVAFRRRVSIQRWQQCSYTPHTYISHLSFSSARCPYHR